MIYKDLGMVSQVLDERRIPSLAGDLAVAHCRYSTTGSTVWENAQPTLRLGPRRALAIGHNGNLVNTRELLGQLEGGRGRLAASTDTELLTALLADEPADGHRGRPAARPAARARRVQPRDPRRAPGHRRARPARLPAARARAAAADRRRRRRPRACGATTRPAGSWRPRPPRSTSSARSTCGTWSPARSSSSSRAASRVSVRYAEATPALCVFELIYFARPDSYMEGRNLYEARRHMGMQLAIEHPVDGRPRDARAGHRRAGRRGLRRGDPGSRTARAWSATGTAAGRSSSRRQAMRQRGVNVKLSPLREVVRDRRLVVVDDSIVRGTTTKQIVGLLRRAGAREVHVRISAPPIYHPCFYGIDTSIETELIASTHSVEEIREFIGADSLGYLSIRRRPRAPSTCRTSGSASPASTATTRSPSRTT